MRPALQQLLHESPVLGREPFAAGEDSLLFLEPEVAAESGAQRGDLLAQVVGVLGRNELGGPTIEDRLDLSHRGVNLGMFAVAATLRCLVHVPTPSHPCSRARSLWHGRPHRAAWRAKGGSGMLVTWPPWWCDEYR